MRRVEFPEGGGILPADFMMLQQIVDRNFARRLFAKRYLQQITSFPHSLRIIPQYESSRNMSTVHSGTGGRTVTVGGAFFGQVVDPPANDDSPDAAFGEYAGAAYTLDANTSGSVWRRDILQARIEAEDTILPEDRDFEDAATRALTTQSLDTRRVQVIGASIKKGTDQASQALADANEPAADAGYVKLFSFLVDNTGTCSLSNNRDYNLPIGGGRLYIAAEMLQGDSPATYVATASGGYWARSGDMTVVVPFPARNPAGFPVRVTNVRVRAAPSWDAGSLARLYRDGTTVADLDSAVSNSSSTTTYNLSSAWPTFPVWHDGEARRVGTGPDIPLLFFWQDQYNGSDQCVLKWVEFEYAGLLP